MTIFASVARVSSSMKRASNRVNCVVYDAMAMRLSYNRPMCARVSIETRVYYYDSHYGAQRPCGWNATAAHINYLLVFDPFRRSSFIGTLMMQFSDPILKPLGARARYSNRSFLNIYGKLIVIYYEN